MGAPTTLAALVERLGSPAAKKTTMLECYTAIYTIVESWQIIRSYLLDEDVASATLDTYQELIIGDGLGNGCLEKVFAELITVMTDYSTLSVS